MTSKVTVGLWVEHDRRPLAPAAQDAGYSKSIFLRGVAYKRLFDRLYKWVIDYLFDENATRECHVQNCAGIGPFGPVGHPVRQSSGPEKGRKLL